MHHYVRLHTYSNKFLTVWIGARLLQMRALLPPGKLKDKACPVLPHVGSPMIKPRFIVSKATAKSSAAENERTGMQHYRARVSAVALGYYRFMGLRVPLGACSQTGLVYCCEPVGCTYHSCQGVNWLCNGPLRLRNLM
ncbi:hypothetical protein [Hymenobacter volaticus]|uniref:Uncharacterized protein n=1 Tax=Hymenobacter volaticus TaxID=2932254 RepID=A0ABY4GFN1_9BACT|nr:hypothetical protein [Hymenobacter volaticus]UOQ69726.1 hypothetical protein MUN86_29895 [Hymenobacter volaticus]